MQLVKDFFKSRSIGFYFTLIAIAIAIVQVIIYATAFSGVAFIKYKHWSVILCSVLAIVLGAAMSCTKWTESFAPLVVFIFELLSFLMFIKYGYMYFSELFFAGVTPERISQMYYGYMASIILYVVCWAVSIAAVFMRQSRKSKAVKEGKGA